MFAKDKQIFGIQAIDFLLNCIHKNGFLIFPDLRYCIGNNIEVKSLQFGPYLVSYTKELLNIGCQSHKHSDCRTFSDSVILDMDGERALDWWNLNKHIIFELIDREQNENN
jgi:hypothetical protein